MHWNVNIVLPKSQYHLDNEYKETFGLSLLTINTIQTDKITITVSLIKLKTDITFYQQRPGLRNVWFEAISRFCYAFLTEVIWLSIHSWKYLTNCVCRKPTESV